MRSEKACASWPPLAPLSLLLLLSLNMRRLLTLVLWRQQCGCLAVTGAVLQLELELQVQVLGEMSSYDPPTVHRVCLCCLAVPLPALTHDAAVY